MTRTGLVLPFVAFVIVACGSDGTSITCPTKAQSLAFTTAGSCSGAGAGMVTIKTQPGLCSILVEGYKTAGIPSAGQFLGTAKSTGYDLAKGNWQLFISQGNAQEGSVDIHCDESKASDGTVDLSCYGTTCPPEDCGGGAMCSNVNCQEHLTPVMN